MYGMAGSKGRQIKILAVEIPDTLFALVGDWEVHETFEQYFHGKFFLENAKRDVLISLIHFTGHPERRQELR